MPYEDQKRLFRETEHTSAIEARERANNKPQPNTGLFPNLINAFKELNNSWSQAFSMPDLDIPEGQGYQRGKFQEFAEGANIAIDEALIHGPGNSPSRRARDEREAERSLPEIESDQDRIKAQIQENDLERTQLGVAKVNQRGKGSADENWTPEAQEKADLRRAELEEQDRQLKNAELELEAEKRRAEMRLAEKEGRLFGPGGLLPGADNEALDALGKILGHENFNVDDVTAVTDAIMNSNLGDKEKQEQLGFIIDNATIQKELISAVEDLAGSRRDLDALLEQTDAQLLGSNAEFTRAIMNWEFHTTPEGRKEAAFGESMEAYFEAMMGEEVSDEILSLLTSTMDPNNMGLIPTVLLNPNAVSSPAFQATIDKIVLAADNEDITTQGVIQALGHGTMLAVQREQEWNNALDQDNFQPGTTQLGAAIVQAAMTIPDMDPGLAGLIADSQDVHAIIAAVSGGKIGIEKDGTRYGIGGMTEATYESLGYVREDTQGNTVEELRAFIEYIMSLGGPPNAIRHWYTTGNWGG